MQGTNCSNLHPNFEVIRTINTRDMDIYVLPSLVSVLSDFILIHLPSRNFGNFGPSEIFGCLHESA